MNRSARAPAVGFDDALEQLAGVLHGNARTEIVDTLMSAGGYDAALERLRKALRSHSFVSASGTVNLRRMVDTLDARTRREGMHVLQGWDFVAHRFPKDIAPVLLLDYCVRAGIPVNRQRAALAILVDQYFLSLLSLLAVRAWDEGDANENLDRVTDVLRDLQGQHGSGYPTAADAETLLMLAVSYYHPEERGYDLLVQRVSSLDDAHQLRFALPCAALLGGHLRWGLRFMYARDVGRMRTDNVADYPLLIFAVLTLVRAHDRLLRGCVMGAELDAVIEALLQGLSADPWAFVDRVPALLSGQEQWHDEVRQLLAQNRADLLSEFERHQPSPRAYSPLGFAFNFPVNATVAMAVLAVQDAIPPVPLNSLFSNETDTTAARLAEQLMAFAASDPNRLGAGGSPLLVYDPFDGVHHFNKTLRTLRTATWT